MKKQALRALLFGLYQVSIITGIVLLPVSVLTRRVGLTLPAGRVVDTIGDTYEDLS